MRRATRRRIDCVRIAGGTIRAALCGMARVTFWGSILLAALLSCAALFFLMMSFGHSG